MLGAPKKKGTASGALCIAEQAGRVAPVLAQKLYCALSL